jgi:hypothetical protein
MLWGGAITLSKEASLGTLMTLCPRTGEQVETGVATDRRTLISARGFCGEICCPACGDCHPISEGTVWVCDAFPQAPGFYPDP